MPDCADRSGQLRGAGQTDPASSVTEDGLLSLRAQKKEETRKSLSRAAAELLLTEGSDGMTVAAITRRAGVSPRTFHNYFARREDALFDFIADTIHGWSEQVEKMPEDLSPLGVMYRLVSERMTDGYNGTDDPGNDPENLFNLMSIGDHLSYVSGPKDKERVLGLLDGIVSAMYRRRDHGLSWDAMTLLIVSSLASAAIAVEATRHRQDQNNDESHSVWTTAGHSHDGAGNPSVRSAGEILDECFRMLRSGFGR